MCLEIKLVVIICWKLVVYFIVTHFLINKVILIEAKNDLGIGSALSPIIVYYNKLGLLLVIKLKLTHHSLIKIII
jgi:hypothetical protein